MLTVTKVKVKCQAENNRFTITGTSLLQQIKIQAITNVRFA